MNIVNIDLASEPLTTENCNILSDKDYPFCLLGFQLKNSYDQVRLQLKTKYKINDYMHLLPDSDATPSFFRGMAITPKGNLRNLFIQLGNLNTSFSELPVKHYQHILSEYNLTCNNCYAHLQRGVYPIDGECINELSDSYIDIVDLYTNAFNNKNVPAFQSCAYFTIFVLNNRSIFRHNVDQITTKFIKNNNNRK
jgi:hypothetical protein